ncbi:lactococcin 972 family bacteriocin [Terrabacter terrigena]|uniref:Lactococcin 972 family bacteriocin n=1 Tax=Terrabacter terrigena TaxID=574718 RepID=A0ABW3N454_9MICO
MRTRLGTSRTLTAGLLLAAALAPAAAGPASAADSSSAAPQSSGAGTVVDGEGRTVGGWVELDSSSGPGLASSSTTDEAAASSGRQDVGGGVWTYGSYDENGQKHCWSKYYNSSYYHSATAVMTTSKKVYAWQFYYADAHISESIQIGALCKVYWAIYP